MTLSQHAAAFLADIDADIADSRDEKEKLSLKRFRASVRKYAIRHVGKGPSVKEVKRVKTKTDFANMPDEALVRQAQILQVIGISPATFWRYVKDNTFPRPHKLSVRVTVWRWGDVKSWMNGTWTHSASENNWITGK